MTGHRDPRPATRSLRPTNRFADGREEGMVTAFVLAMTLGILALAGLTLDGGLALAAKVHAIGQAEEAARAGAQQLDLTAYRANGTLRVDRVQAQAAAQRFLTSENATGTVTVSGNTVTVTVTATEHTQLLGLVGVTSLTVTGVGKAIPERGILAPGN